MIVSRIEGGLGNQMFQYAFGLFLARKHNTCLLLDTNSYNSRPQHGYMLDHFTIGAREAEPAEQRLYPSRYRPFASPRFQLPDWLNPSLLKRVKEKPFGYQPHYLKSGDNAFLVGYWQSEKFFPGIRAELLEHFQLRTRLSACSQSVIDRMYQCPSVALHIRRGDYLSNPENAKLYEQLSREYYQACLDQWAERSPAAQAFIFSNDIKWCQENLRLPIRTQFVNHTSRKSAYEDMIMMSHAECCVTANSTFSWWAAYLNERASKLVFVPKQWFRPGTHDGTHIAPESWIAVDSIQTANNLPARIRSVA